MTRHLILGTAGHIDHGKTALVRALTNIDTDRLPEEKQRGITIDIGFAHLELESFRLGIVDVPGHERFIKNMVAGASGVDLAMLLVAADDSVMPQTREHLEILQLLGLRHGLVVISKCDLASDEAWLEMVEEEVRELVAGTFLDGCPVVRTSAVTGQGIEELKRALAEVCGRVQQSGTGGQAELFRLGVDRSFAVSGHGTVVTGSVWSGAVQVGDEVEWLPAGKRLRVRGLQNHDRPVQRVEKGQRAAVNLTGVHHRQIVRGHEIARPGFLRPTQLLTVRLYVLPSSPWPIRHRRRLRLHLGTAERIATVSLLEDNALGPGQWGKAQLYLNEPVVAVWGQPFVVRSESPMITTGGGQVLQPVARRIRRRQLEAIEQLEQLWSGPAAQRAGRAVAFLGTRSWTEADLAREAGVPTDQAPAVIDQLLGSGELVELELGRGRHLRLHRDTLAGLEQSLVRAVGRYHREHPLQAGMARQRLAAALDYWGDEALVQAVTDRLLGSGQLAGDTQAVRRPDFAPKLSAAEEQLRQQIIAAYEAGGFQPPDLTELQRRAGPRAASVQPIVELCLAQGLLVHISNQLYVHAKWADELRRRVRERLEQGRGLAVSEIRDMLGTTRKYTVPYCEYLDRIGLTRRQGDLRVLAEASGAGPPPAPAAHSGE